ncbi:MAG TPA: sigma-54 dependent transcriptional regulator [Woeseiaceae bacterium]|nr:sigma-54 dependent transcriptional regulator [Woeseiaceae bacterium]
MTVHRNAATDYSDQRRGRVPPAVPGEHGLGLLVGDSEPMQRLYDAIRGCAPGDSSVFLVGESGSGKERVARTIHQLSPRAKHGFVPLFCGALSPELLESELFGDDRSTFPGGVRDHAGYLQRAAGGTLFLDDITEMNAGLQARLLQVLEGGAAPGTRRGMASDARIITATSMDPEEAVERGRLNADLYRRLAQVGIRVPTLRERGEDIVRLAEHFLRECNAETGAEKEFQEDTRDALRSHDWPGNVRELKEAVRHSHLLAGAAIKLEDLPGRVSSAGPGNSDYIRVNVGTPLSEVERRAILSTLEHYDGDKKKAADTLKISLKTLYNRLKQYNDRQ